MNTFIELEQQKAALLDQRKKEIADHEAQIKDIDRQLKTIAERTSLLTDGVDLARADRARLVVEVRGDVTQCVHGRDSDQRRENVRQTAVDDARRWLASNVTRLQERYVGVKNYSGFGDQREDHGYGMGPRHGNIVFSIGLTRDARKRALTSNEVEDALYLLHVLPALAKAQKAAA